ncbi:MAG: CBS domain-containing protein, partial [Candidatus Hydrothermarchaeaceae archaeon]
VSTMKPKVKNYMSTNVITVAPDQTIEEILRLMREEKHDGFPVMEDGRLIGIVTTGDFVFKKGGSKVRDIMSKEVIVTFPETNLLDAARVMFRMSYSRLPVVDEDKKLIGIITNADVIRSQIERATPDKVKRIRDSLEKLHAVKTIVRSSIVKIEELIPTQGKIHPDEFRGREYEMKRGLAEPIVVVKSGDKLLLVDGHHRALAAHRIGLHEIEAYIIVPSRNIEFGLEKTARAAGLHSIEDMKISIQSESGVSDVIRG